MAATSMDLSTISSSAQVFTSPANTLPQIRSIHKQLHVEIDDRAARLRTQVGTSYRDLLGTADAIVRMRSDMDAVQAALGSMGGRCGRSVVGAKAAGLDRFVVQTETPDSELEPGAVPLAVASRKGQLLSATARTRLLDACALVARRVLAGGTSPGVGAGAATGARGDRLLVAAKVLLLSRLVAASVGDGAEPPSDPRARASAEAVRKRLERSLERSFTKVLESEGAAVDRDDVLKALCAVSLATNKGAHEVLRLFLHVREGAMALALARCGAGPGDAERGDAGVLACLGLYTRTLLDVQALVPSRLAEALAGLKKDSLLEDPSLLELEGLRLDVYSRWCGDEIRFYKPYMRHDDLDGRLARETLAAWAGSGGDVVVRGLTKSLEGLRDLRAMAELRGSVLRRWIRDGGRVRGLDPTEMLDGLRGVINDQLLSAVATRVHKLRLVGSEVRATLDSWRTGVTDGRRGLWDDDDGGGAEEDGEKDGVVLDSGGNGGSTAVVRLTQDVISRLYGRSNAVSRAVACYSSWRQVVEDVGAVVDQLRRQKWSNDVDEIEDEDTIEHRQRLLSREDPDLLQARLDESLEEAFAELDAHLRQLWAAHEDGPDAGPVAMYLLRVLRDIRSQLPPHGSAAARLGLAIVPALHDEAVQSVTMLPLDEFAASTLTRRRVVGRALWEGEDIELPTAPSPGVFTFLRSLVASMADAGTDLWTPPAVAALKRHLRKRLNDGWLEALPLHPAEPDAGPPVTAAATPAEKQDKGADGNVGEGAGEKGSGGKEMEEDSQNGATTHDDGPVVPRTPSLTHSRPPSPPPAAASAQTPPPISGEERKDLLIQWLFDISLMRCSLGSPAEPGQHELGELQETVYEQTGLQSAEARQQLLASAQDYWKRTGLLFGLLA